MAASPEKFTLLRSILKALGLSAEAVDDLVSRIVDLLSEKDAQPDPGDALPYAVRDDFLSPAEQSFYLVLKAAVGDRVLISPKVSLGDLFYARVNDPSRYRTLSNRIDRKHVDFLLCDPRTVRPVVGIELDDRSHQRSDRQARDAFVEKVFAAAALPLVRIPVRTTYAVPELQAVLEGHLGERVAVGVPPELTSPALVVELSGSAPHCPKCGGDMILRTARTGTHAGGQFWGCSHYPRCRGVVSA